MDGVAVGEDVLVMYGAASVPAEVGPEGKLEALIAFGLPACMPAEAGRVVPDVVGKGEDK